MGMPCQDAQDYCVLPGGILLVALADGAGSAAFSDQGARAAVNSALRTLSGSLENGLPEDNEAWKRLLHNTFGCARTAVLRLAEMNAKEGVDIKAPVQAAPDPADPKGCQDPEEELPVEGKKTLPGVQTGDPASVDKFIEDTVLQANFLSLVPGGSIKTLPGRDYATTLTCAIVTATRLVVGHLGDGVVVAGEGDDLFAVTQLQRGEYANETLFLTQADALDQLAIEFVDRPVRTLAVMSDGLIRLALKMPAQQPHAPFFQPLFQATAAMQDEAEIARQLSAFLGSERVNARTDDDKSLVLAVRVENHRVSGEQPPAG